MKIAMDSRLIPLFRMMLNPSRQIVPGPNLRYWPSEKEAFDIVDDLDKISKSDPIPRFCRLPSNEEALKENQIRKDNLPDCCRKGFNINKKNNINKRIDELRDFHADLYKECKLLAEAEQCKVNVIITIKEEFINKLSGKAKGIRIIKPADYFK